MTLERVYEIGLGQLRFDPISFLDMTIDEFVLAVRGFYEFQEMQERQNWERTRWLATIFLQPHSKKSLRPESITTFPWEQNKKPAINGESLLQQLMKS